MKMVLAVGFIMAVVMFGEWLRTVRRSLLAGTGTIPGPRPG